MMKKVELLAPAGNFDCFLAAINAGADAVYIGGDKYGARAYADNFSEEEVIKAINISHLFGKRLYMTINTLTKNSELDDLVPFMKPYYEAGLDGVIVQDMGVFQVLKRHFPDMELHASTQMTLTGAYGAKLLKDLGSTRIVPARELSLDEIKKIKDEVDIEIEAFIHGAMCYAYSGQCLFSSILGGRSGNRGRCAGPCRLPYSSDICREKGKKDNEMYPLSLKDMYTLPIIPQLIEAGIDSFKIEGRMKSPEYVAGVTSVYRKYIDLYYKNNTEKISIDKADERIVTGLYIRSGLQQGYYHKHNGKDMITIKGPGYSGIDDATIEQIREKYIETKPSIKIVAKAIFCKGEKAKLYFASNEQELFKLESGESAEAVLVEGNIVDQAQKRPLSYEDIKKQLNKMGDTVFSFAKLEIIAEDDIFMPVKAINELRRETVDAFITRLLKRYQRSYLPTVDCIFHPEDKPKKCEMNVLITSMEQLRECVGFDTISKIYIDIDLVLANKKEIATLFNNKTQFLYLSLPYILRKRSYQYLESYKNILLEKKYDDTLLFEGVLVRNPEEYVWLEEIGYSGYKVADANIYIWNKESKAYWSEKFNVLTVPVELNKGERKRLSVAGMEETVYGRIPMMYSANCTRKTLAECNVITGFDTITDRYKNKFSVFHNCKHCMNVIYNTVPLSLHQYLGEIIATDISSIRLEFTNEDAKTTQHILKFYEQRLSGVEGDNYFKQGEYTTGHYKRGVE